MDALFGPSAAASSLSSSASDHNNAASISSATAATPIGQMIERATAETLINSDWALNMEVVDLINNAGPECAQAAVAALKARLQSPNPKVLLLSLTLVEAVVKNGTPAVHALVGSRAFWQAVGALTADGPAARQDVRTAALTLVQQCGLAFEADKDRLAFYSFYMELRVQGRQFPPLQASSPVFSPPPQPSPPQPPGPQAQAADGHGHEAGLGKLAADLGVVEDGVAKLLRLLPVSKGIGQDEALAEAVGFLESCQPRLEEVIEAGMEGALNEALLERALVLHDELVKALDKERAAGHASLQEDGGSGGATDDLLDFGDENDEQEKEGDSKPAAAPPDVPKPIPTHPPASTGGDAFDIFLGGGGGGGGGTGGGDNHNLSEGSVDATSSTSATSAASAAPAGDGAVLAEADALLRGLGLEEQQQGQQQGQGAKANEPEEGKATTG